MHDSMMIAEVGFMLKVSGSRIAMPLAPPRPGSTPISTPSVMPMSMKPRFGRVSATPKPCIKLLISSMSLLQLEASRGIGQKPSRFSIGPLGRGTRNHRSKTRKKNSGTPTDTEPVKSQP